MSSMDGRVTAVVFAGPSFRGAVPPDGIEVRRPAKRGDLLEAVNSGIRVIGLADGVFASTLAVSNSEVRAAAKGGARLFGAASMGALRAVECPDAMVGLGWIYEQFRTGHLTDDDEVALVFDSNYFPLSVPLVRVRFVLRAMVQSDEVSTEAATSLITCLKLAPFDERTEERIALASRDVMGLGASEVLMKQLRDAESDVKGRDTRELVARVQEEADVSSSKA